MHYSYSHLFLSGGGEFCSIDEYIWLSCIFESFVLCTFFANCIRRSCWYGEGVENVRIASLELSGECICFSLFSLSIFFSDIHCVDMEMVDLDMGSMVSFYA